MRCLRLKTPGHAPGPILARPCGRSDGLGPGNGESRVTEHQQSSRSAKRFPAIISALRPSLCRLLARRYLQRDGVSGHGRTLWLEFDANHI